MNIQNKWHSTLLAIVGAILIAGSAFGEVINVFLVGGDSNALGSGVPSELPAELQDPQTDISYYQRFSSQLDYLRPVPIYTYTNCSYGPEITFGRAMADFYAPSGAKVAIIKSGYTNNNFWANWAPDGTANKTADGATYRAFQTVVTSGTAALQAANPNATLKIRGMIWIHGEADASQITSVPPETNQDYSNNLTTFIQDIRATYNNPALPFVFSKLSASQTSIESSKLDYVRAEQQAVADATPNTGIAMINTDAMPLLSNHILFDSTGLQDMGSAFAEAMKPLLLPYNPNGVPCAYVLKDDKTIDSIYTYPANTSGQPRGDLYETAIPLGGAGSITLTGTNNPVQAALDRASDLANSYGYVTSGSQVMVCLDSGTFTFPNITQGPHNLRYGVLIQSSIHLKGVWNSANNMPASVIAPDDGIFTNGQSYLINMDVEIAGSKSTSPQPYTNVTVESIKVDAKYTRNMELSTTRKSALGLGAYSMGTNLLLDKVHVCDTGWAGLIVGFKDITRMEDNPEQLSGTSAVAYGGTTCKVWSTSGYKITNCNVTSIGIGPQMGGDAIAVRGGSNGEISNCTFNTVHDNGIVLGPSCSDVRMHDNVASNCAGGFGADGTRPLTLGSADTVEASKSQDGYNTRVSIYSNTVSACKTGVGFHRAKDSQMYGNTVDGSNSGGTTWTNTTGLNLETSDSNYVYGNTASNCTWSAMTLVSTVESRLDGGERVGTAYNNVGIMQDNTTSANNFSVNNTYGVKLQAVPKVGSFSGVHVCDNTISGNNFGSMQASKKTFIQYAPKPTDPALQQDWYDTNVEMHDYNGGTDWYPNAVPPR